MTVAIDQPVAEQPVAVQQESAQPLPVPPELEVSHPPCQTVIYSEDETMKRRLLRKRQLEEEEIYNAPETMAVKRRAVKEAAKTMPVPHKIPNLTFDDQIEPSVEGDLPEQGPILGKVTMRAAEYGSNAAQSGVGAAGKVVVETQKDAVKADEEAEVKDERVKDEKVEDEKVKKVAKRKRKPGARKNAADKAKAAEKAAKKKRVEGIYLPLVKIDPIRWVKKSDAGARRSRHRLRRILKEEQALLSSQLQVV